MELAPIAHEEGLVEEIYLCPAKKPTLGLGTLITPDMPEYHMDIGTPVSQRRCAEAFFHEVGTQTLGAGERVFGAEKWALLPFPVRRIFLHMLYNMGEGSFADFEKMIKAANECDWGRVVTELLDSKYARDDVPKRARRLAKRLKKSCM